MSDKDKFLCDLKDEETIEINLMVMRIIFKDPNKTVCILADKTGESKSNIASKKQDIKEGMVLKVHGTKGVNLDIRRYEFISEYNLEDYLPTVKRPIEDIMNEIEEYTNKYIISKEGKALNDYFLKMKSF